MEYNLQCTDDTLQNFCKHYGLTEDKSFEHFFSVIPYSKRNADKFNSNGLSNDVMEHYKDFINQFGTKNSIKIPHIDLNNIQCHNILFNDVQIGDFISVEYFPYSQKYLEHYNEQNVIGKVFFIDYANHDMLLVYDKICKNGSIKRTIGSFNRWGCSYFGDTKGYSSSISKYITDSQHSYIAHSYMASA